MLRTLAIALSMSADAFAASIGQAASLHRPKLSEALRMALIFGSVEALTPIIGWLLGRAATEWIASFDHWVAFGLLGPLGFKMIWESTTRSERAERPRRHSLTTLIATALGTSIDALVVGLTVAVMQIDIVTMAISIGAATFAMTLLGVFMGRAVGPQLGRAAEAIGGIVLISIGALILVEHLGIWVPFVPSR